MVCAMSKQHPKRPRPGAGRFGPWIDSWSLSLQAEDASARTRTMYLDIVGLFGGWLCQHEPAVDDWDQIRRDHLRRFFVWLQTGSQAECPHWLTPRPAGDQAACNGYGKGYVNNVARGLQQFFAWFAEEEQVPNPMLGLRVPAAPAPDERLVPVITTEQLTVLVRDAESGRDFESRRDAAVLRIFACAGVRLAELALLRLDDVDQQQRQLVVTGKGGRQRIVKIDHKAALALDRYLRIRRRHPAAALPSLWLGVRRRTAMTPNGIYQMISRRGGRAGIKLHPHMFRHTFSHRWLDAGGGEGDLMELAGWSSPQMLRHYGRSARSARARRAYDRTDVMGGI
jgi:integrase/recombinase XerD